MKKLTDEQLSRVLSQHANGQLKHHTWFNSNSQCGCVAGVVLEYPSDRFDPFEAIEISDAISPDLGGFAYPPGADEMLRLLEKAGLA